MPRITHLVAAATFVGGLTIAGLAAAEPGGGRHGGPMPFGGPIDFQAIDTDGNGTLSRAELMARATARIASADGDKNGSLDRAELAAALPGPEDTIVAVFAVRPADRLADRILAETGSTEAGSVTVEVLAARQVNMLLAAVDTDRNAAISLEEADTMPAPRGGWHDGEHGGGHDGGHDGGHGGPGMPDGSDGPDMRRGALGSGPALPPPAAPASEPANG